MEIDQRVEERTAVTETEPQSEDATSTPPLPADEIAAVQCLLKSPLIRRSVKQTVETFLTQHSLSSQSIMSLTAVLQKPRPYFWKEQTVAAWLLGYSKPHPEERTEVLERLLAIVGRWPLQDGGYRLLRGLGAAMPLTLSSLAILAQFGNMTGGPLGILAASSVLTGIFWLATIPILSMCELRMLNQIRAEALVSLGRLQAVESIPTLAKACLSPMRTQSDMTPHLRGRAAWSLCQVLPCVMEADYGCLASETVPSLCQLLEHVAKYDAEPLALAILTALGKIGDGRAVLSVERVADRALKDKVRSAAVEVLPILQERRRLEGAAQTLLRGASRSDVHSASLLRIAAEAEPPGSQDLLRAGALENKPSES